MKMRGKVLRAPGSNPGLLIMEGQQYRFALDGVWKSEIPPKPGLDVEAELDNKLQILAITILPDSQLGKERAEAGTTKAKQKRGETLGKIVAQCGEHLGLRGILKRLGGNTWNRSQ
jgi:hypothetical protein